LRAVAHHSRRDLNASNLFVHNVLMRTIEVERGETREPQAEASPPS
jgi:hypothetical protein